MRGLTSLWRRLLALVRPRRLERDLDDEIAFHLAMRRDELEKTGTPPAQTATEARRQFGSTALRREETREAWVFHGLETTLRDVRFAVRGFSRAPGFTAAAIFVLALGIGANAAIFSLIRTILLQPLPFADPGQLAFVRTVPPNQPDANYGATVPDYLAWRSQNTSFTALAATWSYTRTFGAEENGVAAERITGQRCTPEFLQELGITPLRGRLFTAAEDEVDHPAPVVLISERLWRRRFASDPDILGKSIRMDGRDITIIGVMNTDFQLFGNEWEFFEPFLFYNQQLQGSPRYITVLGRLKPGVTMSAAQSDIDVIARRVAAQFPQVSTMNGKPWGVHVQPMQEELVGWFARPLLLLQGAVAFLLLIACANIAGLQLARASARHREVGIRLAIGASRGRLIRQFLTESLVLALFGGALGVSLGWGGLRVLVAFAPPDTPRLSGIALDPAVLAFSVAASVAAGLIFGLVPALHASAPERRGAVGELGRIVTSSAKAHRLRMVLVAGQLALALVSLTGAGLLARSFLRLEHAPLNADPSGVLTFQAAVPRAQYGKATGAMYQGLPAWEFSSRPNEIFSNLLDRARSIAGVQSAAAAVFLPFTGANDVTFAVDGAAAPAGKNTNDALYAPVSDGYFRTMKIPLVQGREFTDRDVVSAPWVAVISETMARRFWPDADPIGKRLTLNLSVDEQPREIVGVARDTPSFIGENHPQPMLYIAFAQRPAHVQSSHAGTRIQMSFMLRTTGDPLSAIPAVRHAAAQADPEMPVSNVELLDKTLGRAFQYPRAFSLLLGVFAGAAILLAAIGIYGVMAYGVAQRAREIGIRMALGASGTQVIRLVLRGAAVMLAVGVGVGVAGSFAVTRLLASFLWQIKPTDAPTFAASAGLIVLVGVAASIVPAMRVLAVDPTIALRSE
jgi:putative ABC transport system permease protein